jgi:hypothetical protein
MGRRAKEASICAVGSWGGQRPGLAPYVTGTGPRTGPPPPEGVHATYPLAESKLAGES